LREQMRSMPNCGMITRSPVSKPTEPGPAILGRMMSYHGSSNDGH
jgi:hypothetical protein